MRFDDLMAEGTAGGTGIPAAVDRRPAPSRRDSPAVPHRRTRSRPHLVAVLAGLVVAMGIWAWSLGRFRLQDAGDLGVLQAMPASFAVAVALAVSLFAYELTRAVPRTAALVALVACLVVMLFSVPNLVDGTGMMPVGYLHAGFSEYISAHHEVLRGYDARFSWPAFFALVSVLVDIGGLPSPLPLLSWAPIAFELAALAPMLLLARSILGRGRTAWIAVVLYYCGCWFSQDYLAPQAMDHLLYLSAIAVLFWTVSGGVQGSSAPGEGPGLWSGWRGGPPPRGLTDRGAVGIQVAVTVIIAAMVVTHQLTPIGFVLQLMVLSVIGGTRYRALWLVGGLLTLAWFSYGARDFWVGHLTGLVDNVGKVDNAVNKGLSSRVSSGDPTYLKLQKLRTLWSGGFLVAGGLGAVVLLRRRNPLVLAAGACALTPFALILLQSYGGEIFLRCFLYSMPFLGVLSAAVVSPLLRLPTLAAGVAVAVVIGVAAAGLVVTRGVNISFERVSPDSLAAAQYLAHVPPVPGQATTRIGVAEYFSPLGAGDISKQKVTNLGTECESRITECALESPPRYILLNIEQEMFGRMRMQLPPGWLLEDGAEGLVRDAGYRVVFERPGAVVLRATRATTRAARAVAAAGAAAGDGDPSDRTTSDTLSDSETQP